MFKEKLALIPNLPGSYQMLDANGTIIYVGKAKNLHKRVASYFNRPHTGKTALLVSDIKDFTYIVASSEVEAFLIEINLIKKYDPKYNIMLRDDKSYPYIEYISKPYPKLKISRYLNIHKKDKKLLFGPYPNAYAARRIVNLLNRLYPLKKCEGNPKELCLYYHIGECLGYCTKALDQTKVKAMEDEILSFLRGNDKVLKNKIMAKMKTYSDNLNFELAATLKEELQYINVITEKQKVELHDLVNRDVFGYYFQDGYISINTFYLRNGKLVGNKNVIYNYTDDEDVEKIRAAILDCGKDKKHEL
jgi:excinuclease ABC subunit C